MKTILFIILSFIYVGNISAQDMLVVEEPVTNTLKGYIHNTDNNSSQEIDVFIAQGVYVETGVKDIVFAAYNNKMQDWYLIKIDRILRSEGELIFISESREAKKLMTVRVKALDFKKGFEYMYNNLIKKEVWFRM